MDPLVRGGLLRLDVHRPIKAADRYEFRYDELGQPLTRETAVYRLKSVIKGYGSPFRTRRRFGFRALNFRIAHSEVWDSVFPLLYLTRNGGPLFKKGYDAAVIRFRYPILESARQFFVRRASNLGLSVEIEADTIDRTYDIRGRGNILALGGGKDSRLVLGLLREIGQTPRLTTGGVENTPTDLSPIELSEPFRGVLAERVMPGLMSGAAHFYFGSALAEGHFRQPWHQYYDLSSWQGQRELTELFRSFGVELRLHAPVSVLPSNLVQKVLSARYPALSAHQQSVDAGAPSQKNLHVSLLKMYHGIPFAATCDEGLFRRLVQGFVTDKLSNSRDFGFHDFREFFHREMMAIISRRKDRPLLDHVTSRIPPEWEASWIDCSHTYVNPDVDASLLEIFRGYAKEYIPAPGEYRIPIPPLLQRESGVNAPSV